MLLFLLVLGFIIIVGLAFLVRFYNQYSFHLVYIKVLEHVYTSSLKFLSSAHLSFVLQSNVGCFMMGPLILGTEFSPVAVPVMAIVWIAALAALTTACLMCSLVFVCSFAILLLSLTHFCVLLSSLPL